MVPVTRWQVVLVTRRQVVLVKERKMEEEEDEVDAQGERWARDT